MESIPDCRLLRFAHHYEGAQEAGLPDGVINLVFCGGKETADVVFGSRDFAGLHFGSTAVFNGMWKTISENISRYRSYPRIVGETGGKDYVLPMPQLIPDRLPQPSSAAHSNIQGQKCSLLHVPIFQRIYGKR